MGILRIISGIVSIIDFLGKIIPAVIRMFQKNPVEKQKEAEKKHEESSRKAELDNDTSGSFGG